jgi:hypothetical protein
MRPLWPPLTVIESNLFAPPVSEQPQVEKSISENREMAEIEVPPMPAFLQELIQKRVKTQTAIFSPVPTSGQILLINSFEKQTIAFEKTGVFGPVTVLIDKKVPNQNGWTGWMVATETDYAGYWDMLLESEDEPFDPLAGMIQSWNPVKVVIPTTAKVLAELQPARLQAVRALAEEQQKGMIPAEEESIPGQIAPRDTLNGFSILTGTRLGDEKTDPRYAYQELYKKVAKRYHYHQRNAHLENKAK